MKSIILKLTILIGVILALQYLVYTKTYYGVKPLKHLHKNVISESLDVLYLEASINLHIDKNDTDTRPIYKMIRDELPNQKVDYLSHGAYTLKEFLAYTKYMIRIGAPLPKTIIYPINLRAFTPMWYARPQYLFVKEHTILGGGWESYFYNPLSIFKYTKDTTTEEEYHNMWIYYGDKPYKRIKDYKIEDAMIANYLNIIADSTPHVQALKEIISLTKKVGIKPIFYFNSIDYEYGEKMHGPSFKVNVQRNLDFLSAIVKSSNCELLNLTFGIPSEHFDYGEPNEHVDQWGRLYIARALANHIKQTTAR